MTRMAWRWFSKRRRCTHCSFTVRIRGRLRLERNGLAAKIFTAMNAHLAMQQAKKGKQWYFGMKAHICVDADTGLVHTVTCTPASVADVTQVDTLLHGKEKTVHGGAGYTGVAKRRDLDGRTVKWHIA